MKTAARPVTAPIAWEWMLLALGSHTAWGVYPVLARYLQNISGLPGMAMLAVANSLNLAVIAVVLWRRGELGALRSPVLWGVAVLAMLRSVTNVISARYTPAVYVQLANLLTPFMVVGIAALAYREPIPARTAPALLLSLLGALAMLVGEIGPGGLSFALRAGEWLGVGLAVLSSLALALYMLAVRHTSSRRVSGEATFGVQLAVLIATSAALSLAFGEDWGRWRALDRPGWLVFAGFTFVIVLGANLTQINALRRLGAPLVSSLQAWRLIAALLAGGLLLGEWLAGPTQLLGAGLVIVTISWYLWQQRALAGSS